MTKTEFTAHKLANLGRATTDPRLSHLDVRLLCHLMLSVADGQTGIIRRAQADLAEALRITRRSVQLCRDHLVDFGYLEAIGKRRSGYVSGYKIVTPERRTYVRLAAADHEKANLHSPIGEPTFAYRRTAIRTNTSLSSPLKNLPSDPTDTEPAGLAAPLKALGPLASHEAELRSLLGERFRALAMGQVIELTGDGELVIATPTPTTQKMIRQDCEADLLAFTGAACLKFVIKIPAGTLQMRRMP